MSFMASFIYSYQNFGHVLGRFIVVMQQATKDHDVTTGVEHQESLLRCEPWTDWVLRKREKTCRGADVSPGMR